MRKNLLGSKRKAINIYFALYYRSFRLVSSLQQLILYLFILFVLKYNIPILKLAINHDSKNMYTCTVALGVGLGQGRVYMTPGPASATTVQYSTVHMCVAKVLDMSFYTTFHVQFIQVNANFLWINQYMFTCVFI